MWPALLFCVLLFPDFFNTVCLALKALHVQEERDRLRLELNELEERVNPNFLFFLSFFSIHGLWCVWKSWIFFSQSACSSILPRNPESPYPDYMCMSVYTLVHNCLCTRIHMGPLGHSNSFVWASVVTPSLKTLCLFKLGVFHAFSQQH